MSPKPLIEGEWVRKNPPKRPMYVRIGGMVSPGRFWVRELPIHKSERVEAKGVHAEVTRFEYGMATRYNVEPKANPENAVKSPKLDMLVAVRPDHTSTRWFRGKIVNIGNQPEESQTLVKVFLIDYGLLLNDINCKTCVRVLPRIMTFTKGLAKVVILAGIRPLTLSVDFQLGMEFAKSHQEMSANWSTYSHDFMRNVLDQSVHKLAILRDWRLDAKKKIHGDLILLGFTHKISLCKLLVTTGHGDFFPELLKSDLEAKTEKRPIGPKFTSIVAPGSTPGTRTLEPDMNFTTMSHDEMEEAYVETPAPDEEPPPLLPEDEFKPFIPQARMERTIKRNKKKKDWHNRTSEISLASTDPREDPNEPLQADGGMPFINWDDVRSTEFVDSSEDEDEREVRLAREAKREEFKKRSLPLPAGIDIGNFIAETVARMPEPAVGPKQIRPDLLQNPDRSENYHDDDQYFDSDLLPDDL